MSASGVDESAVLPNLALGPGLNPDPAHLFHGQTKLRKEILERAVEQLSHEGLGDGAGGERGVGLEQPPPLQHLRVVAQIERPETPRVHFHDPVRVYASALLGLQIRRVLAVQRRVLVPRAREVVQPPCERRAVGYPDRVSARE